MQLTTSPPAEPLAQAAVPGHALPRRALGLARTLARPGLYRGLAREVVLGAYQLAAYPLGMVPALVRPDTTPAAGAADRALPIVLVHGWSSNRSAFLVMGRGLRGAGFPSVHAISSFPLPAGIPRLADGLAREVERVLEASGTQRCVLVGHSLGGLVARVFVQDLGGDKVVDTVVTLGTPHRGTYTSYLAGPAAAQLRPGSAFLRRLEETARANTVRWLAYWSDLDVFVVPSASARLDSPALGAVNIRVRDAGHAALLTSRPVLADIVRRLR